MEPFVRFQMLTKNLDDNNSRMGYGGTHCQLPVLKQTQKELEEIIGLNRKVEEYYIDCLPYLHVVVKEVFRLHPALPLEIPHRVDN